MALALETLLPTPYGWTSVADLTPDSLLIDELGYPCRIKSISEPYQAETYAITAGWGKKRSPEDGVIYVTEDQGFQAFTHAKMERMSADPAPRRSLEGVKVMPDNWPVWKVSEFHTAKPYANPFTADQITSTVRRVRRKTGQTTHLNYAIPITFSLQLPHTYLKVDPYILGVLLNYSDGRTVKIPQKHYAYYRDQFDRVGYTLEEPEDYRKSHPDKQWLYPIPGLKPLLQDIGFRSNRIPPEYLRGSTHQRMALVQGLLDQWNPYFSETNRAKLHVAFTTKNADFSEQILELVRSLGYPAFVSKKWDNVHQIKWHPVEIPYRMPMLRSQYGIMTMRTGQNLERYVWKIYSCDPSGRRLVRDIEADTPHGLYSVSELFLPVRSDK